MEETIYDRIKSAITEEGDLKSDFNINTEEFAKTKDGISVTLSDGITDGLFPCNPLPVDEMIPALKLIEENRLEDAVQIFSKLLKENTMLSYIDGMQRWILTEGNLEKADRYVLCSHWLMECSFRIEMVKLGMSLAEVFEIPDDMKDVVRTLSLCEEFTLYGLFSMRHWENGNQEIFELAKHVYDWGRVHALEYLQPETQEIKDWIFHEGQYCGQLQMYTSQTCAEKCELLERLENPELSYEDFVCAQDLMRGLFEQSDCGELCEMEGKVALINAYYEQAERQPLTEQDNKYLQMIQEGEAEFLQDDDTEED